MRLLCGLCHEEIVARKIKTIGNDSVSATFTISHMCSRVKVGCHGCGTEAWAMRDPATGIPSFFSCPSCQPRVLHRCPVCGMDNDADKEHNCGTPSLRNDDSSTETSK